MPNKMIVSCEQFDILHLTRLKFLAQNDFHILCCGKIFSIAGQTSQSYLVNAPNMAQKRSTVMVHNVSMSVTKDILFVIFIYLLSR